MDGTFSEINSYQKSETIKLNEAKLCFLDKLNKLKPPFAVLLHGSTVYRDQENMDNSADNSRLHRSDLDCFTVVPDFVSKEDLKTSTEQLLELSIAPSDEELELFYTNKLGIIRAHGAVNGSDMLIGLHIMRYKTLADAVSIYHVFRGVPTRNDLTFSPKYQEFAFNGESIISVLKPTVVTDKYMEADKYFAEKTTNSAGKELPAIGILADKFLTSEIIYSPEAFNVQPLIDKFWRMFVRSAIYYRPDINNEEIIGLFSRAPRFSALYRDKLTQRIQAERGLLKQRRQKNGTEGI